MVSGNQVLRSISLISVPIFFGIGELLGLPASIIQDSTQIANQAWRGPDGRFVA